jgi:hypothetical protein
MTSAGQIQHCKRTDDKAGLQRMQKGTTMRMLPLIGLVLASPAAAADAVPLWSGLLEADTPLVVVSKLSQMPDVKRAKLRGGDPNRPDAVDVNLQGGGIEILGERYGVELHFEQGGLTSVYLDAQTTCANDVYSRYARVMHVLSEKYSQPAFPARPELDESAFLDAKIKRLNGLESKAESAVSNGLTVAIVDVVFDRLSAPSVYGPQSQLAWSIYRIQASACGGTGTERSRMRITYISAERWARINQKLRQERRDENDAAKERL